MRLKLLLATLLSVAVVANGFLEKIMKEPPVPTVKTTRAPSVGWIVQNVDNFNSANMDRWQMRYYGNDEFYQAGGPIFIYVGGEWEISPGWLQGGHMVDMARQMNGYTFYTEHRYYGQSIPVPDASTDNLRYLHIDQALADLAHFIRTVKTEIPGAQNSGVILVGGSYAGTMVAWFRQRYPELVNGAWASSAPLLAKVDYVEYKEVVGASIKLVSGDTCYNRLEGAFAEMERLAAAGEHALLSEKFNLCYPIDPASDLSVWNFFDSFGNTLSGIVQYHWPGDIEGVCDYLTDASIENDLDAYLNWIRYYYGSGCLDVDYDSFIQYYRETSWNAGSTISSYRQWIFQTCNEYGWYQTSGSNNQPFGSSFPVDLSIQMCADLFDNTFTNASIHANADRTNEVNGGMNPDVTNVFFTHGQLDPWSAMGLSSDLNAYTPVVTIPMHSHCADLYSISASDTPEMRQAKERVTSLVRQWLGL